MTDSIRVLVVDDDAQVCEIIKYRLSLGLDNEFDVVIMSHKFDRLEAPGTFQGFDCLVLDLWLEADGILHEFPMAHKIFSWARADNPNLPIVLFSAVIGLQHRQDIEDEAEVVMSKSNIDSIEGVIKTVTQRRRSDDWSLKEKKEDFTGINRREL